MNHLPPPPEIPPVLAVRVGLLFPALVLGGRVLESNFERTIGLGWFRFELGDDTWHNLLIGLLALGAIGAARTALMGPSRWKGLVGVALVAICFFASSTDLAIPALRRLGS